MKKQPSYTDVLLEDMNSKFDAILEIVVPMHQEFQVMKQDMSEMKSDIKVIKLTIKDITKQLDNHEHRMTRLETKLA